MTTSIKKDLFYPPLRNNTKTKGKLIVKILFNYQDFSTIKDNISKGKTLEQKQSIFDVKAF